MMYGYVNVYIDVYGNTYGDINIHMYILLLGVVSFEKSLFINPNFKYENSIL